MEGRSIGAVVGQLENELRDYLAMRPVLVPLLFSVGWFAVLWVAAEPTPYLSVGVYAGLGSLLAIYVYRRWMAKLLQPRLIHVIAGVATGVALVAAAHASYPLLTGLWPGFAEEVATLYVLVHSPPGPMDAFPLLLVIVLGAELLWRGVLLEALRLRTGPRRAVLLSALACAVSQAAIGSLALTLTALLTGLVWAALSLRFRSLVPSFIAHVTWCLGLYVLAPL